MSKSKIIRVRDVMKTSFELIDGIATVSDALKQMKHAGTSVLVVNKRHDDDEYGLITSAMIAKMVLAKDRSASRVNVYEIMDSPIIAVRPEMDIRYCSKLFAKYELVRAAVIENNQILGLISPNSLVLDGLYHIC